MVSHNDIQECNIIAKHENNLEFTVIDFEYASYNPRSMDIANYINETIFDNAHKGGSGVRGYVENFMSDQE